MSASMSACFFCDQPEFLAKYNIKQGVHWDIQLYTNQCYLGWCTIVLKRHFEDFADITAAEMNEVIVLMKELTNALKKVFQPDRINYAVLGNRSPHVHMLVVPRYASERSVADRTFTDTRWGKNYAPYDKTFVSSEGLLQKIKVMIKSQL